MMVTGTVVAGTKVARQLCRNTTMTTENQHRRLEQGRVDLIDRGGDEKRRVEGTVYAIPLAESGARAVSTRLADVFGDVERVGARQLKDRDAARPGWPSMSRRLAVVRAPSSTRPTSRMRRQLRRSGRAGVLTMIWSNCAGSANRPRSVERELERLVDRSRRRADLPGRHVERSAAGAR